MKEVLTALSNMIEKGELEIDGVTIGNSGYEIEIGNGAEHFEGDIKLRVTSKHGIIELGNIIAKAMKDE